MDYMKELIKKLTDSVPEQTKANVDARYNLDKDTKGLIEAFAKVGIALGDEDGNFRDTYDVLKDMREKYEQLYGQDD